MLARVNMRAYKDGAGREGLARRDQMQIEQWFSTDDCMGPSVKTLEEARTITREHNLRGEIAEWFTVGGDPHNTFCTRKEAEDFVAYVKSMSMGG